MQLSENAMRVLESRCLLKDNKGRILESAVDLFERVAHAIAQAELHYGDLNQAEEWEQRFYETLTALEFLPNSPTLMNAGTPLGQLSACFVLPVEDSLDAIFTTLHQTAIIQQSGGGTGFNFSHLRPAGDLVQSTSGQTSGPLSFMKIFDTATQEIRQGGKRRGANMGILDIHHPDIEAFINCKQDSSVLQNFNLSVAVTEPFMRAVSEQQSWVLKHPATGKTVRRLSAGKLWKQIVHNAWTTGDPGLVFLDEINRHNPTPALGRIESTNPCGEVPLLPYESCNLGSLNLSRMAVEKQGKVQIDWPKLTRTVHTGIRFLDNVIDVNQYPFDEIRAMTSGNRKIGLGVMGWADLLIRLGIPYDSQTGANLAVKLMKHIREQSLLASAALARERGVFPHWKQSTHFPDQQLRNATVNSIAPTGSISIIADTSSSIEPHFALAWNRIGLEGERLSGINTELLRALKSEKLLTREVKVHLQQTGSIAALKNLPSGLRKLFRTALEISPERHLAHQIAFQRFTDNAVSKTINLPMAATPDEISSIFMSAWKGGAKGITVYRDGSRDAQVLYAGITERDGETCCVVRDTRIHGAGSSGFPDTISAVNHGSV